MLKAIRSAGIDVNGDKNRELFVTVLVFHVPK